MFTGIIQQLGEVSSFEVMGTGRRLWIKQIGFAKVEHGESIAVNGCCLTVVGGQDELEFDLSEETLQRTTMSSLRVGDCVNLERSPTFLEGFRFGGHQVTGHVDAVGEVIELEDLNGSRRYEFQVPKEFSELLIDKGSVAIDGASLTVNEPADGRFWVSVIPYTFDNTVMKLYCAGTNVNLEFDLIGKYVVQAVRRTLAAMNLPFD